MTLLRFLLCLIFVALVLFAAGHLMLGNWFKMYWAAGCGAIALWLVVELATGLGVTVGDQKQDE